MTATIATRTLKDGLGNAFDQRVLDASGAGSGPFLPLVPTADPTGTRAVDFDVLLGPYRGVVAIVADTDQTVQRSVLVVCTVAGNLRLKLSDDSAVTVPVAVGLSILPFAVKTVVSSGTTATASCYNLV